MQDAAPVQHLSCSSSLSGHISRDGGDGLWLEKQYHVGDTRDAHRGLSSGSSREERSTRDCVYKVKNVLPLFVVRNRFLQS